MRIAIAGISHETNTYCQGQTVKEDFYCYRGKKMFTTSGQQSDVGGAIDACAAQEVEAVPILFASTQPSGTIAGTAYDDFKTEIIEGLEAAIAGPQGLDACVLLLHGAGVVDGIEDLEGDLAHAVRNTVGDIPVTATFDLHGNVTQFMADQLNGVFACHQYPHVDLHLRAADAINALVGMVRENTRAQCAVVRVPMLLATTTTFEGIGESFLAEVREAATTTPCLEISWFHGFPYTDVEHVGAYLVVSYFPGQEASVKTAHDLAHSLWRQKQAFEPTSLDGPEVVGLAQSQTSFPVVIHETSDNCGGGAPGDGTHLLRAMLEAKLGAEACFSFLVDAQTAAHAHAAGVGATIDVEIGGRTDDMHGEPIKAQAYVKALHDGRLIMQAMFKGAPLNIGPMARLIIDDMDVVVASRRSQTFDCEPFLAVGIDVKKYKYVALKSSNHFRAGFTDLAGVILTADTPGLMTHQIERFSRQKTTRRLWPIDAQAQFPEL